MQAFGAVIWEVYQFEIKEAGAERERELLHTIMPYKQDGGPFSSTLALLIMIGSTCIKFSTPDSSIYLDQALMQSNLCSTLISLLINASHLSDTQLMNLQASQ